MREFIVSNSEKQFIAQSVKYQPRLDGRTNDEYRKIKINYGTDWGSAIVALGETKVLAQVSCELGIPKAVRPNEGMLFINVEIGPMAAPHLDMSHKSQLHCQINRTLERTLKDSKAVDLESLCIRAEEHAWTVRVDLNVLNHDGNIIDCCSMAALCALAHFRRPDISIEDSGVIIHTAAEKELLPLVLHHYPVCVSFITFNDGKISVIDPNASEERTGESKMVFGLNPYRELCCLNLGGGSLTSAALLLQSANRAAHQAKKNVDFIKASLAADMEARESGVKVGFTECLKANKITGLTEDRFALRVPNFNLSEATGRTMPMKMDIEPTASEPDVTSLKKDLKLGPQCAIMNSDQPNIKWVPDDNDDEEDDENVSTFPENLGTDSDDSDADESKVFDNVLNKLHNTTGQQPMNIDSDSEEEDQVVL